MIFIVAITWLYVILMMAVTERSVVGGLLTFFFYGLVPCALLMWLTGAAAGVRERRRQRLAARAEAARAASVDAQEVER